MQKKKPKFSVQILFLFWVDFYKFYIGIKSGGLQLLHGCLERSLKKIKVNPKTADAVWYAWRLKTSKKQHFIRLG
jgi:hypothetical protein